MIRHVLVPLDGSEPGEAAVPWAVFLAHARGYSVVLARAIPWPVVASDGMMGGYVPPDVYDDMMVAEREGADASLEAIRARLAAQGVDAQVVVREGSPYTVLLDLADELGVDAVVMATHGRGGLPRAVLGSVANYVVQHATIPVLLVRADGTTPAQPPAFDRLLVPLDGSSLAERALDCALEIAQPDSRLVLVRADESAGTSRAERQHGSVLPGAGDLEKSPATYLSSIAETLRSKGRRVDTDVRLGRPAEQILEAARAHESDVIVMGTHGRSGPARWLLGSVADEVVRHADRPVLLVSVRTSVTRSGEPYTVGDMLTGEPILVREDESLDVVLRKLLRQGATGVGVVRTDGDLVGIVSERELTDWHDRAVEDLARQEAPAPGDYARRLRTMTAASIMVRPGPALDASTPLGRATHLFRERGVARLPVTRDGRLVGILTRADVLRAMAARVQAEAGVENPSD
jgi:nucleotide-binding universal stress UspA family protein/predicted transcriptional regulator